jgi:hypothetical protein
MLRVSQDFASQSVDGVPFVHLPAADPSANPLRTIPSGIALMCKEQPEQQQQQQGECGSRSKQARSGTGGACDEVGAPEAGARGVGDSANSYNNDHVKSCEVLLNEIGPDYYAEFHGGGEGGFTDEVLGGPGGMSLHGGRAGGLPEACHGMQRSEY